MAGLVNWISGAGSLDLGSAQAAINELVEEREQMQARIAELEESQKLLNKTVTDTRPCTPPPFLLPPPPPPPHTCPGFEWVAFADMVFGRS